MDTMNGVSDAKTGLELIQIGWVVNDIHAASESLAKMTGVAAFRPPQAMQAEDMGIKYNGQLLPASWLVTQAYNGKLFIELIQPLSDKSMFRDYLQGHPSGGIHHIGYRIPLSGFEAVVADLGREYAILAEADHPIARIAFFDTRQRLGVDTEIMGITPGGWDAVKKMEKGEI